jgi:hypothetical protein
LVVVVVDVVRMWWQLRHMWLVDRAWDVT